MKENRYFKKLAKLRYKADKNHAKADMLTHKNKHKKAGKFEGKAQHFEMKLRKVCDKLTIYSNKLKYKEEELRQLGNPVGADKLRMRIQNINQKTNESQRARSSQMKTFQLPPPPPKQAVKEVYREKEIVKEIVRIPCKFCNTYIDHTETKCPSCGASLEL